MSVLLQVSDTHFGTERPPVVEALVAFAAELRPDLVVLSGDITQRARRAQFDAARRLAERLPPAPLLALPGNHDIPLFNLAARLLRPYAGYARVFGMDLEPSYESHDLLVLGVNTTRAYRHKHGEVSRDQIERVAQRLRSSSRGKLRIVVTHHPLLVPPGAEERNLLRGHARAARAWAAAGADLVMGGHVHLPFVRRMDDPALWVAQAGTAVSRRVRAGALANSLNVVRYEAGLGVVERWDHDGSRFALVERVDLKKNGDGPPFFSSGQRAAQAARRAR
jgi:3',5'-cyclic AMP phosphodiesterase CpdA